MPLTPGATFGPYQIVRSIGRGGMASVLEAHDPTLDRALALKILPVEFLSDEEFVERFRREARLVSRLEHPNIVPIYASGIDESIPWMAMRLVRGGTLASLLSQGLLSRQKAVEILSSVAAGLDYAHSRGIVHRDVKPQNVLIDESGHIYLSDFGIARMVEGATVAGARLSLTRGVIGTPHYMAPEQANAEKIDHRCDIYSVGVMAYEMLTGKVPFSGETPIKVLMKQVMEAAPVPSPEQVPTLLMDPVLKALAKKADDRWPSAGEFADSMRRGLNALSSAQQVATIEGPAAPAAGSLVGRIAQRSWRSALGGLAILALLGFAAVRGHLFNLKTASRASDSGNTAEHYPEKPRSPSPDSKLAQAPAMQASQAGRPPMPVSLPSRIERGSAPLPGGGLAATGGPEPQSAPTPRSVLSERPGSPLEAVVDCGTADDCFSRGLQFLTGSPRDSRTGALLLRQACDLGSRNACVGLGKLYETGEGVAPSLPEAIHLYSQSCDAGGSEGCVYLGFLYESGKGVVKNLDRAIELFEAGCAKGSNLGCQALGHAYETGTGVAPDVTKAMTFYDKACRAENWVACKSLGFIYQIGNAVPRDDTKAAELFNRGCRGNYADACLLLAKNYSTGSGVSKDEAKATRLVGQACDLGNLLGCHELAARYLKGVGVSSDTAKAVQLLNRVCDGNLLLGCASLGGIYSNGVGVRKDPARALGHYRKACDGNSFGGCAGLGTMYEEGNGVVKDLAKAAELYKRACSGGYAPACSQLEQLAKAK